MKGELSLASQLILAGIFLTSTLGKLRGFDDFLVTMQTLIGRYRLGSALAWCVLCWEGSLAFLFASGVAPAFASVGGASLLLIFGGVAAVTARSGRTIPCRCFGGSNEYLGIRTIVRALLLSGLVLIYWWSFPSREQGVWPMWPGFEMVGYSVILAISMLLLGRWLLNVDLIVRAARVEMEDVSV